MITAPEFDPPAQTYSRNGTQMSEEKSELQMMPRTEALTIARHRYPRALDLSDAEVYVEERSLVNLHMVWRTVRKRKWLILIVAVIATSVATVEAFRTKSIYQAVASVEVRKDDPMIVKTADLLVYANDTDAMNTYKFMLRSGPLLREVAARLRLHAEPRFLDVTGRKSAIEAVKTLVGKLRGGGGSESSRSSADGDRGAKPGAVEWPSSSGDDEQLASLAAVLANNLTIDQLPEARVLTVSYRHTDPHLAAAVANGVAETFIERNFQGKTQKYDKASKWLDRTTRELKAKVEQAEQALADYTREQNFSLSADGKANLATDKFMRLHDQVQRAETERVLKQSLYEEVKAGRIAQLPEAFADLQSIELHRKLRDLKLESAQLDVKYGRLNPRVMEVRQQITALEEQLDLSRGSLEAKVKADYARAVREEEALKAILERSKQEAAKQNQAEIKYSLLKQDVDTAKSLYTEFLQKLSQADVQLAEQQNDLSLAEPAEVPTAPIGPDRLRGIMTAFFLSLAAGIGLAFLLEYLDNTVKTADEVSHCAQLPALGVIPVIGRPARKLFPTGSNGATTPALATLENRSSAAEAYRVLRTSVLLSAGSKSPRTILVTSGQPGEGKTTTVLNTAISLAQLGSSVLIVDCDLRKPSAHTVFGIEAADGLSTFLSKDIDLDPLIRRLHIPNLSLLPSGPAPVNPAELISSEKMKGMLKALSCRYSHILIDSPPVISVTDPVILSTLVDGVMLVVHGGKSTRHSVRRARHELAAVGAKLFGVVLNNVDFRRDGYSDRYYYYQYYADLEKAAGGR